MHEDFDRPEEVSGSSDRGFGLVIGGFCLIVALVPLLHRPPDPVRWWVFAIGLLMIALALLWTRPLAPLNRLWIKLGHVLYRVVNPIVLALLFYSTITPLALLMRRVGRDPLRLRRRLETSSYWIPREPPGPAPESMKQQF